MANALYPLWKQELLKATANTNLSSTTVKAALISTSLYTYSAAHQFWSSASAGLIGAAQALATKTFVNGTFLAANTTFPLVSGGAVGALILYIDTGVAGTSPLVCYLDTNVTGLPVTPSGGDIAITWDAAGIFTL